MPQIARYLSKDFPIEGSYLRLDDKEKAWEEIDGRMRTAVRKAQASGVVIEKVKGTPEELDAFRAFCLNPDDIPETITDRYHVYFAYLDGKLVAGIILAEIVNKLFMLCHASTPSAKEHEIPSLLIWHVVEQFAGGKFENLDVGASYRPPLQKYFQGWRARSYPMIMHPPELKPQIMLTPFDTASFGVVPLPNGEEISRAFLDETAGGKPYTFFPRATYAIHAIVKHLKDEGTITDGDVWITTTTDTHYVSSCVTSAIEQSTTWSRQLTDKTQAIFLIHEFGFIHPRLAEIRAIANERGIPLIEDCAYCWGTEGTGMTGDYVIYSLTKAFPVQFGGILVGKHFTHEELWSRFGSSDRGKESFTLRQLSPWVGTWAEAKEKRQANYRRYEEIFGKSRSFFPLTPGTFPGGYALKIGSEEQMKAAGAFVTAFGIECANYWKNGAIVLPVHQRLEQAHIDYIAGAVFATEREWCGIPLRPTV